MTALTPLEIALAYFAAWNAHDVDQIASLFGDSGTFWDNQMPEPRPMRELKPGFIGLMALTKNLTFDVCWTFES